MLTVKLGTIWHGFSPSNTGDVFQKSSAFAQSAEGEAAPESLDNSEDMEEEKPFEFGSDAAGADEIPEGMLPADIVDDEEDFSDVSNLSSGEIRLLHDLARRRKELDSKENRLEEREALLRAAEQQLIEKQGNLSNIKSEIEALLAQYETALDDENQRLINVYSNMKPKSAATIFNEMDIETLMIIVRGMKERKVAPILAAMDPEKVIVISNDLANNKELPDLPQ